MRVGFIPPVAFRTAPTRLRLLAAPGGFTLAASVSARPSGTKQPSEVRPPPPFEADAVAVDRRRLRNLSVPTNRLSKPSGSTPAGERHPAGRPRGNRDPRRSGATARCRVGHSWKVTRSSGRFGRAMVRAIVWSETPVAGAGANPTVVGVRSVPQRRWWGHAPEACGVERGRRCCPSSASSSPRRAGVVVRLSTHGSSLPGAVSSDTAMSLEPVPG